MSTTAPVPSTSPHADARLPVGSREEIKIVSHSNLFYWWPVWAVGFLMAILTFFDGFLLTTVPAGSKPHIGNQVPTEGDEKATERAKPSSLLKGKKLTREDPKHSESALVAPPPHGRGARTTASSSA